MHVLYLHIRIILLLNCIWIWNLRPCHVSSTMIVKPLRWLLTNLYQFGFIKTSHETISWMPRTCSSPTASVLEISNCCSVMKIWRKIMGIQITNTKYWETFNKSYILERSPLRGLFLASVPFVEFHSLSFIRWVLFVEFCSLSFVRRVLFI